MKENSSQSFGLPKAFDIQETIKSTDEEDKTVLQAGEVREWQRLAIEKAKTRSYITGIVISIWVIWIIIGVGRFIAAGDMSLLLGSPILLLGPLKTVLEFYFSR